METTVTASSLLPLGQRAEAPEVPALALIWSREEPERVGEVALLTADTMVLGRAGGRRDLPRVEWMRQRPARNVGTGPLRSVRVSRDQVRIDVEQDGTLRLTNLGKLPLLRDGIPQHAPVTLREGDRFELMSEALILVVRRPLRLPADQIHPAALHPFGEADVDGIVGESPAAWRLREQVAFVAGRDVHVLVRGESGTGKELVAQAIHRRSSRSDRVLVSRNAATIPETLIDAELFGHAKGFPNPGMPERPGLVGEADGSTLFLDELAELPHAMQVHLLRVMDQGEYRRLGESQARRADFRLVAATNRPEESLKHDVLARFQIRMETPGLNDRREDVPLLARHLLERIAERDPAIGQRLQGPQLLTARLVDAMVGHRYGTHVRELESLLWNAIAQGGMAPLDVWSGFPPEPSEDAEPDAHDRDETRAKGGGPGSTSADPPDPDAPEPIDPASLTPEEVQACLDANDGMQEPTWRALGLSSRHVLTRLVRKYGLRVKGRGSGDE